MLIRPIFFLFWLYSAYFRIFIFPLEFYLICRGVLLRQMKHFCIVIYRYYDYILFNNWFLLKLILLIFSANTWVLKFWPKIYIINTRLFIFFSLAGFYNSAIFFVKPNLSIGSGGYMGPVPYPHNHTI